MASERKHNVVVVVEGEQVSGWESYRIECSMITPADAFTLKRPFDARAWNVLRKDARIRVLIDGITILDGFIDRRTKSAKDGTMEIAGRDRCGRLVQESAPSINYSGLLLVEAVRRLAEPWFTVIVLSDARNRSIRRGKGRRVPAGNEPIVVDIRVHKTSGKVQPGMTRWQVIEEIVSRAGYCVWSSADGKELIIGKPNYQQAPQFLVVHPRQGSSTRSTCKDLVIDEDIGDCFSLITVAGAGGSDEDSANYGTNVSSMRGIVKDGPGLDGIGRDFVYSKRLYMPEASFVSNNDAQRVAVREAARRNFKKQVVSAVMPQHGQFIGTAAPTIFAPNTIARVIDEELEPMLDKNFLIFGCVFEAAPGPDGGEFTSLEMVPSGTEIVL